MYYAFHGIRSNSNRKDAILRNLPYLGIALVGIGSAVFHSTLINYLQWCKFILEFFVVQLVLLISRPLKTSQVCSAARDELFAALGGENSAF